ncbi:Beta-L-arabinofuranosidase, GH127 [Fusarium oxysporum f. sp. vasinfectum]|nr:Beta-L-arabinofuranosidase, GH127 [Fusarium oxysporum f. sp. vasinfectum]
MVVVKASALFMGLVSLILPVNGQAVNDVADAFDLTQVSLTDSRWMDNQNRTLNYLLSVDPDRLLYVFRKNHGVDTKGAQTNGGWDAPDFPFRSHVQGHFLSAWTQCYASAGVKECGSRATYFVQELAKCQANNAKAGFNKGYLSGFPESDITKVEDRTLNNGNVPYYAIHKTLAGLLDVYRRLGDQTAKDTMLSLASWVDTRTSKLSYNQMQSMLQTEFGGMNEVLADIAFYTKDAKWLKVAQRFDHAVIFDPLQQNVDKLSGLHANTQLPKWIGALREYKVGGDKKYLDIGRNAWNMVVNKHTYAIGGNNDTCEACNSYNMLKLTRELWALNPTDASYFDFYEKALLNHLLGQQDPSSDHGHVTYFTPLKAGGRRGVGPAWGGGTWSTDYNSFWCCQGTGVETNTKLMDSIYFHTFDTLYVNLFTPSKLNWSQKKVSVTQTTDFPESDTSTFKISGDTSEWTLAVRIPSWTSRASIKVNGQAANVAIQPGKYALIKRQWKSGDTVTVQLPMSLHTVAANDDQTLGAIAFGPVILAGNYGQSTLNGNPTIDLASIKRKGNTDLTFGATSGGKAVELGPFYDAQGFNYAVYWKLSGKLSG